MALLALFRPVLFATTAIGLMLGVLVVLNHQNPPQVPQPATQVTAKTVVLPEPEPSPPITAADFQGFQGFQAKPAQPQPQPADPEPPAAAWISTVSPARRSARSNSPSHAR